MSGVPNCWAKATYCLEDKDCPRTMITCLSSQIARSSVNKPASSGRLRLIPWIMAPKEGLIACTRMFTMAYQKSELISKEHVGAIHILQVRAESLHNYKQGLTSIKAQFINLG